ncbi:MAG: VOC family protein [Actinomycetota bacterium]|nr:VOC family protein [Actinomycetota bacterium]
MNAATVIAPATTVGAVHLTVGDVERSIAFYDTTLGLSVLDRGTGRVSLGADDELLVLYEQPGARPAHGYTGLFHYALLVPDRRSLAAWLALALRERVPLQGLSDHYVSEAIYLADPDGHGIEIYCDRPREVWEGQVWERLTTFPLDVDDLLSEVDDAGTPFEGLPAATRMGHVHLRVADVPETVAFYRDVLGFELTAQLGSQAAFFAAGGYHHHVGANTWQSAGAPPPPPGHAALRHATIILPDAAERDRLTARVSAAGRDPEQHGDALLVRDPSGNALVLKAGIAAT